MATKEKQSIRPHCLSVWRRYRGPSGLGFHPSQPRKDRLITISSLGLRIHQDDAYLFAIQKTAMFRRNVENTVVCDGLKFDCIHEYGQRLS